MSRSLTTKTLFTLVLALAPSAVFAHAQLQSADPAVGGTVSASPAEIQLTFGEAVNPRSSTIALAIDKGAKVAIGTPHAAPGNASVFVAPISHPLKPGVYKVTWHAVAADDGGKTQGNFTFTVAP